jgi:hypothetical protein
VSNVEQNGTRAVSCLDHDIVSIGAKGGPAAKCVA